MAVTSPGAGEDVSEPPLYELGRDQTPAPSYPPAARRRGQEGTVVVRILVVPDGSPAEVEVVQSSGHPLLDEAACETLRRWHLKPARHHGTPVPARIEVPVQFVLQ
ncbi:MAG: energy transducer TonB [Telmatospirillum sp.]|nr:energy transducer TonB [Telmatospirillum sp.]